MKIYLIDSLNIYWGNIIFLYLYIYRCFTVDIIIMKRITFCNNLCTYTSVHYNAIHYFSVICRHVIKSVLNSTLIASSVLQMTIKRIPKILCFQNETKVSLGNINRTICCFSLWKCRKLNGKLKSILHDILFYDINSIPGL